jgi:ligand-binding SRPBCC domain-containing protein
MKEYIFEDRLRLPVARHELFPFFADAANLQSITPSWVHFRILTPMPVTMRPGALIDYRIRVHGFPIRWRTEIEEWDPPRRFVDRQLRGPYRLWHHTHVFEEDGDGTLCIDRVRYAPIGGALMQRLFVRADVERIFRYRRERLTELFPDDRATGPRASGR